MTDQDSHSETRSSVIASASDLAELDLAGVVGGINRTDEYALERALIDAAKQAEETGNQAAERGYRLFVILCSLHLRVEDPAETWGPRFEGPEGRTNIASDFRGEQSTILAEFVSSIPHPALRARVADVVWYNERSRIDAATAAIEAYSAMIAGRLDGTYVRRFEDLQDSVGDLVDYLHRALQITAIARKREAPDVLREAFGLIYDKARETGHYVAFDKVARLGLEYELTSWEIVTPDADEIAQNRIGGDYPMAVQLAWNLAAQGYGKLGDDQAKRRCQEASVDETLKMRDQVGSASAKAFWVRKAIGELRAARGFTDRIAALRAELRDLQDASLDEFGQVHIPLDLADLRQGAVELFEGLTLPDLLLQFALIVRTPTVDDLRKQALETRKKSFLSSFFGTSHSDREGKVIAETGAGAIDREPDENWFKEQSLQYLDLHRHQVVGGLIEPARRTMMARFPLEERHFVPIISMSPFVPTGHEHLMALGFTRFFQGDYASAAYLLIPQLENSLRFVLLNSNRETSKIKPDLLQEDRSLSGLLQSLKPELEEIFGADLVNEIDLLFNFRAGPALRHEVAHGKLTSGACYHPSAIYACWLMYRLTCLPLVREWKAQVAPAIEQAAF